MRLTRPDGDDAAARPAPSRNVLIVDDDSLLRRALCDALTAKRIGALTAGSVAEAWERFSSTDVDVVLLDEQLPDGRGHALCQRLVEARPVTKVVFMTAFPEFEHAVKAIRAGAYDYLAKPFELEALFLSLRRCFATLELESIERRERYQRDRDGHEVVLVGDSPAFAEVRRLVSLAASADAPVLITGETGTGKSLVAKAIHFTGARSASAFVPLSCAALPDHLVEAELFGWERGAFTGAVATHDGAFEMANGGTLFLDEIGDMPLHLQPKLLAVLEERSVRRLGGRSAKPVNVRIVAATNADVPSLVEQKLFRPDLYYRLAVVHIHIPPLRERTEDLPALAQRLIAGLCPRREPPPIDAADLERLASYAWPGNVRELRNVLERALLLQQGALRPSKLVETMAGTPPRGLPAASATPLATLAEVEERHVAEALHQTGGNLAQAARLLGVSLSTLKRRAKRAQSL